jgi:hypothetical protein
MFFCKVRARADGLIRLAAQPIRVRAVCVLLPFVVFSTAEALSTAAAQRSSSRDKQAHLVSDEPAIPSFDAANADTYVVAEFSFDDGHGGPDPQGWFGVDLTEQAGVFWHVDNYEVPTGGGTKCMWCGVRSEVSGPTCYYECPPGYGNDWDQILETPNAILTHGDVTLSYLVSWDTESGYDVWHVEYLDKTGEWIELATMTGVGHDVPMSHLVPRSALAGSIRFRFRMISDMTYSDEDCLYDSHGAIQLDNIEIADSTGVISFEDFEGETIGSTTSADGVWTARGQTAYGDYAGIFAGNELAQEDPSYYNSSHFWAFVKGSEAANASFCSDPDTLIIPFSHWVDDEETNIHNAVWSPVIDWTVDKNGAPIPFPATITLLQFRVYRNMNPEFDNNVVFYTWQVRSFQQGSQCVASEWLNYAIYWGDQKDWHYVSTDISDFILPGHDRLQVALGVIDLCGSLCNLTMPLCHTQAPFFDDVRIVRVDTTTVGTGIREGGPLSSANMLMPNYPNPFNPSTTIRYSIAAPGQVELRIYDVSGRLVRTLFRGIQKPGPDGLSTIWDARNDAGEVVPAGVYFCELKIEDFRQVKKLVLIK